MKLIHKKKCIAENVRILRTSWETSRGLMFTRRKDDFCLYFSFGRPVRYDIHMWFVFYTIDAALLDQDGKILELLKNFKPFAIHFPKQAFHALVELPAGSIKKHDLDTGDLLTLTP